MPAINRKLEPSGGVALLVMRRDPYNNRPAHHPISFLKHALPRPVRKP